MRSVAERTEALRLAEDGLSPGAISRATGIPHSTVRGWLNGRIKPLRAPIDPTAAPASAYSYLLGAYLGDGHIAISPHKAYLRIYCDAAYRRIVEDLEWAIHDVRGGGSIHRVLRRDSRCLAVQSCWLGWPELFPQHGPGRKHERPIRLAEWQRTKTYAEPQAFLRGLIHSDGCRFIARQASRGKIYAYVRYSFSNLSNDIRALYCEHLELLGVRWIQPGPHQIDVNRRADVAKLEAFVGPKM